MSITAFVILVIATAWWVIVLALLIFKGDLPAVEAVIPLCWIIFILYWLVTSLRVKGTAEKQSFRSALAHRLPVVAGYLLIFWRAAPPVNRLLIPHTGPALATGITTCVLGLFVTLWARWTLAGNWSSDVTFKQGHELITTGPYHFVRHPIYTGLLIMCLGTAIEIGQLRGFLGLACVAAGFWIKLKQEERLLLRHFPGQYPAYCKRVKALVPFLL